MFSFRLGNWPCLHTPIVHRVQKVTGAGDRRLPSLPRFKEKQRGLMFKVSVEPMNNRRGLGFRVLEFRDKFYLHPTPVGFKSPLSVHLTVC